MIRQLIGHRDAVAALNRSLAEKRLAHAYLFAGPPGVGKATLALELAKALNCRAADAPCGECAVCRRIEAGKHPDVETVRPGGICDETDHDHTTDAGRDIRICQVRRAERVLGLAPFEGSRRVLIVDPAETMNAASADAFLKTLEEPPNGAVIVLVSASEGALSETIRSRCRRVLLRPMPVAETDRALRERFGATPEQAAALTRLFGGQIGRAVTALRDPEFGAHRAAMLNQAAEVAAAGLVERFAIAEKLSDAYARRERPRAGDNADASAAPAGGRARNRADVFATLDAWVEWWRDLLLVVAGAKPLVANAERTAELAEMAGRLELDAVRAGLRALREARRDLEENINPRLAIEALMVRLPRPGPAVGARAGKEAGVRPSA